MGFTKFGDKRVNDLDLLSGYVVGSACSSLPVRLDHLFFTCRFCLQCFVPSSFCCIFICTTPNKPG